MVERLLERCWKRARLSERDHTVRAEIQKNIVRLHHEILEGSQRTVESGGGGAIAALDIEEL